MWFDGVIYECSVYPSVAALDYECTSFKMTQIEASNYQNGALRIINDAENAAGFSRMELVTSSGDSYKITGVCIDDDETIGEEIRREATASGVCPSGSSQYNTMWRDNQMSERWPPTQFVYFDLSRPNQAISDAEWSSTLRNTNQGTSVYVLVQELVQLQLVFEL